MLRSLFSGVAGMQSHQTKMDVIGNNIANVNTSGFKASRVSFKDVYYQTVSSGTNPTATTGGGNSRQIGYGSQVGSINVLHSNSGCQSTGNPTDCYIGGDGYFIARDPQGNEYYKRLGDLTFDEAGSLVDSNRNFICGYPVMRDAKGDIVYNENTPKGATTKLDGIAWDFGENMGSTLNGYSIEIKQDADLDPSGNEDSVIIDAAKKTITISMNGDGSTVNIGTAAAPKTSKTNTYEYLQHLFTKATMAPVDEKDPTKLQDVPVVPDGGNFMTLLAGVKIGTNSMTENVAALAPSFKLGGITVKLDEKLGDAFNGYSIRVNFGAAAVTTNTAELDPTNKVLTINLRGNHTAPATVTYQDLKDAIAATALKAGEADVTFDDPSTPTVETTSLLATLKSGFKIGNDGADLALTLPTTATSTTVNAGNFAGTVPGTLAKPIEFDVLKKQGAQGISGGLSKKSDTAKLDTTKGPQKIKMPGTLIDTNGDGIFDDEEANTVAQLSNISIAANGTITGIQDGRTVIVGQICLAQIPNPEGLSLVGNSYYQARTNTGKIAYTVPGVGSGELQTSALESSNVDLSTEFSDMIITQRGFQANSRIITVSDEMLQELVNLKR